MNRRRVLPFLFWSLALLSLPFQRPAAAGTIGGHIHAKSAATESPDPSGSYSSRRYKFLEKIDYNALRDFVVYIDQVDAPPSADRPPPKSIVTQRDGAFVPHVLPIVVGTIVDWPNADDVFHNVFCMSETTPFDLGLYKHGDAAKSVVFPKTGRMEVFCSIHTKMNCIVLVLPNPWFARADDKGRYLITNVPAGTYLLKIDLVIEGLTWFEPRGSQVASLAVNVG